MTASTWTIRSVARRVDPTQGVRVLIVLLPLWWLLGIDQLVWPFAVALLLLRSMLLGVRMQAPAVFALASGALLVAMVAASTMVADGRELTYVRNLGVHMGGWGLAVLVIATHRTIDQVAATLRALAFTFAFVAAAGAMGALGVRWVFDTPMYGVMGPFLDSAYVQPMVTKSLVHNEATWFSQGFLRPRGLMLFPNILGAVAALSLAAKLLLTPPRRRWFRWTLYASAAIEVGVIVATLSRSTWLALLIGLIVVVLTSRLRSRAGMPTVHLLIVLGAALALTGALDVVVERIVHRGHSNEVRLETYMLTLDAVLDSPATLLIGHGTQRGDDALTVPVGSHSTYLGMLFKYGAFGLLAYGVLLWSAWRKVLRAQMSRSWRVRPDIPRFLLFSITFFGVQGWFIEMDVDAAYLTFFWVLTGLSYVIGRRALIRQARGEDRDHEEVEAA